MIADLRSVCGVDLYLSLFLRKGVIHQTPTYRVLSEVNFLKQKKKARNQLYDIPAFLNDSKQPNEAKYSSELLRKMLATFVRKGEVEGMKELHYPRGPNDPDFETTFNILGPAGLTTATTRVVAHFAACKVWLGESGETELAIRYGELN